MVTVTSTNWAPSKVNADQLYNGSLKDIAVLKETAVNSSN